MSDPERDADIERLTPHLVNIDEGLACGESISAPDSPVDPGEEYLGGELHEAQDCLLRLERIWPRGDSKRESSAGRLSASGGGWPSLEEFIQRVIKSGLVSADETHGFVGSLSPDEQPKEADELARLMIDRRLLTYYQLSALAAGKAGELVLGNYVVLEKLGQGGMGTVFKARHRAMNRIVALKVPPPAVMRSPVVVERFRREVEAAAKLSHPNIVAAYDAGSADGVHFLAMEYVAGSDLAEYVQQHGPTSVLAAVDFTLQAARGLAYAHGMGVIHRDIKPANLVLDAEATVKILDMGLARIQGELATNVDWMPKSNEDENGLTVGGLMGTVDYMAPEQALDPHAASDKSDIYSLGCTLHYLLTTYPVYAGETTAEKLVAHRESTVVSLREVRPDVPPRLESIFRKMVAKRPEDRFDSMRDVVGELEACLLQFEPSSKARRLSRIARPRSAAALLIALGAILLLIFAGDSFRPSPQADSPPSAIDHQLASQLPDDEAFSSSIQLAASRRESGDTRTASRYLLEARDRLEPIEDYSERDQQRIATYLAELGGEHLALEDFAAAESCLNRAAAWLQSQTGLLIRDREAKRTLARVLAGLCDVHRQLGDWQQASELHKRSHRHWTELYNRDKTDSSIYPEMARSHYTRGEISLQMNDTVAAEQSFKIALQIEPTSLVVKHELYDLLSRCTAEKYQSGDYTGAWEPSRRSHVLLEEMAAAQPNDEALREQLGTSFFYLGDIRKNLNDLEGAAQYFKKSLEFNRGNGQALRGSAECFNTLGDRRRGSGDLNGAMRNYERANEILDELVQDRPGSARDKRTLADSFDRLGSTANAFGDVAKGRVYFEKRDALLRRLEAPDAAEQDSQP